MHAPPLNDVIARARELSAVGQLPIVVFDLDSTLFSTAQRNLRILREFGASVRGRWPHVEAGVAQLNVDQMGWNVSDSLHAVGVTDPVIDQALVAYWFARFFTDAYVRSDAPTPGAVAFARAVHDAGAFCYYLTGRDVGGMAQGTVAAITDAGFPFWRGRTSLHLKPTFEEDDHRFKLAALEDIRSHHGTVIATFENEPENANLFLAAFPDAQHFLLQTVHSPKPVVADERVVRIDDFQ